MVMGSTPNTFDSLPLTERYDIVMREYKKQQDLLNKLNNEVQMLRKTNDELKLSQAEQYMIESESEEEVENHNKKPRKSSTSSDKLPPPAKRNKTEANNIKNTAAAPKATTTPAKKNSPPAIMAYFANHKEMIAKITQHLKNDNFTVFIKKDHVKIQCLTNIEFQATKEFLKASAVQYYTFTPREEKPTTLVIKNISNTYETDEIKAAIEIKVPEIKIITLKNLFKCNWLIQLKTKEDVKSLKSIRSLLGQGIRVENFRGNKIMQCKNCQRYSHIASNCNMPYRCVKCGLSHQVGLCTIPKKEENIGVYAIELPDGTKTTRTGLPLNCANCGDEHASSFSKCPARPVKEEPTQLQPHQQSRHTIQHNKIPTTFRKPNVSYSKIISNNSSNSKVNEFNLNEEIKELFGKDLNFCLTKISNFIPKYNSLESKEDKKIAMFHLMFQICIN